MLPQHGDFKERPTEGKESMVRPRTRMSGSDFSGNRSGSSSKLFLVPLTICALLRTVHRLSAKQQTYQELK